MRQVSEISAERVSAQESRVSITFRTPEFAKALNGAAWGAHLLAWSIGTVALAGFAWQGGFGAAAHTALKFCIADAVLFWATHDLARLWQMRSRTARDCLVITLTDREIKVSRGAGLTNITRGQDELRFSTRPDPRGKLEERDERRAQHSVGYELRDGWEIWCEVGVDVHRLCAVHHEDDARAIVRHLSEENVFVTRGLHATERVPNRAEPA